MSTHTPTPFGAKGSDATMSDWARMTLQGYRTTMDHHMAPNEHDRIIDTVFNYHTLAECYKTAAFDELNRLE